MLCNLSYQKPQISTKKLKFKVSPIAKTPNLFSCNAYLTFACAKLLYIIELEECAAMKFIDSTILHSLLKGHGHKTIRTAATFIHLLTSGLDTRFALQ